MAIRPGGLEPHGADSSGVGGPLDGAGKPRQDRIAAARNCGNNVTGVGNLGLTVA